MLIESIHWLILSYIITFLLGAILGPGIAKMLLKFPRSFVRPNFLVLEGYLLNRNKQSRIKKIKAKPPENKV